jgi:hypothetical protein
MSPTGNESRANGSSPEQLEADIERQREELADTVDALHAKLDVKTRAKDKAADVRERATTDTGKPKPQVIAGAVAVLAAVGGYIAFRVRRSR